MDIFQLRSTMEENKVLKKLLEQQAKIAEQIKIERQKDEKKRQELHNQKALLIGLAILQELKINEPFSNQLKDILDQRIKSKKDRALLGLS
jgi:hypothetical protein